MRRRWPAALLLLGIAACMDWFGPPVYRARLALVPEFDRADPYVTAASHADRLRIRAFRQDSSRAFTVLAKDTVVGIHPDSGTATASLTLVLLENRQLFRVILEAVRSSDGVVLFQGQRDVEVTATAEGVQLATDTIPIPYVGPRATRIMLAPRDTVLLDGGSFTYRVSGFDVNDNPVNAPVNFTSSNTSLLIVGKLTGQVASLPVVEGQVLVYAMTPDSVARDTARVLLGSASSRGVHWVDRVNADSLNQLGTPTFPFRTIPAALAVADPGDTIRVRTGTYPESLLINQPVVLEGDSAGGPLPLITRPDTLGTAITINTPGLVALAHLRLDTLYRAMWVRRVNELRLRNMEFRSSANGIASVMIDSIGRLTVRRSQFFGNGDTLFYTGNTAIYLFTTAGAIQLDSNLIANYGDDALELYGADTLIFRGNQIHDNYGWGVYSCTACYTGDTTRAAVMEFTGNRIERNRFGQVYGYYVKSARFRNNVIVGGGPYYYDALWLEGHGGSVFSLIKDSIEVYDASWLEAYVFDSLYIDSVRVRYQGYGYGYIDGGRVAVVRNTKFTDLQSTALDVYPYPRPATKLVLRNVEFAGAVDTLVCNRCGNGVYADDTDIDADTVTGWNLNSLINKYDSSLVLRNASVTHAYYVLYSGCGRVQASGITGTDAYYGIYTYGFGCPRDSALIDSVTLTKGYSGITNYYLNARITNSVITDYQYGIYHYDSSLVATDNRIVRPTSGGIYFYLDGGDLATVRRNTVTCDATGATTTWGIEGYDGPAVIANDTIQGCLGGIWYRDNLGPAGTPVEIRGNVVQAASGSNAFGIQTTGFYENLRVVGNSVTGPAPFGAIRVGSGSSSLPTPAARIDSNTVIGALRSGINTLYVDTLYIRDNVIRDLGATTCCTTGAGGNGAIVVGNSAPTNVVAQVWGNRITDTKSNGIVLARDLNDTVTVLVDSNTVRRADSTGIWIDQYSKALVRRNAIDSAVLDAVRSSRTSGALGAVTLRENNFTRSRRYGVNNLATFESLTADNNWWNDPLGPRGAFGNPSSLTGDSVSNRVTWMPPLDAPAAAPIPTSPPALVVSAPSASRVARLSATASAPLRGAPLAPRFPALVTDRTAAFRPSALPRSVSSSLEPWLSVMIERDQRQEEHRAARLQAARERRAVRAARLEEMRSRPAPAPRDPQGPPQ